MHAVKYQAIVTPDGLVSSMAGPVEGSVGDWRLWKDCGLENIIRSFFQNVLVSEHLYLYGDAGYYGSFGIMGVFRAFPNTPLTSEQTSFNTHMLSLKITVEQGFGMVSQKWAYNSYRLGLQTGSSPVAGFYLVSVLFTNILTCLRQWNVVCMRFSCTPPLLSEYLR
jgi:hypothetical protein